MPHKESFHRSNRFVRFS